MILDQFGYHERHLEGDDVDDIGHDRSALHPPDLVWTSMGYEAVVSAVVAGIAVAVAGRDRRPAVLVSVVTATPQRRSDGARGAAFPWMRRHPPMTPWASKPGLGPIRRRAVGPYWRGCGATTMEQHSREDHHEQLRT